MDKQQWLEENQTFELDFHSKENYRWDKEAFFNAWDKHFCQWCNVALLEYRDKTVLDVGCGSVPAIDCFGYSVRFYIDPLISDYTEIPQVADCWSDKHLNKSFCCPAEEFVFGLENACMFINFWNALDHAYDWRKCIENVTAYARKGCIMSFSTDYAPHKGHTGIDNPKELYDTIAKDWEVLKDEPGYWGRDMALLLRRK